MLHRLVAARGDTPWPATLRLLLTGGTGFLGGAIAAELIATPAWERTLLLVRAPPKSAGRARVIAALRKFLGMRELSDSEFPKSLSR